MVSDGQKSMGNTQLYPLRFEPIYQYRLWGGRRLASLLSAPLPGDGPIGEAWVLSDRTDFQSLVANGPLKGQTLGEVMAQFPEQLMGKLSSRFRRFPLLLKFLDAHEMLSVQVHPSDDPSELIPAGDTAKTEAWVVIEAEKGSQIYAGLRSGTTAGILRKSLDDGTIADHLVCITPKPGDAVFIPGGTVHTLGDDVVVFEVQQNSDTTFRLYDWGHIDPVTKEPRPLQTDQAFACIEFGASDSGLVASLVEITTPVRRERLFDCMPSCCGGFSGKSHSPLGRRRSRAFWLALRDRARLCMMEFPTRLARGMSGFCRPRLESAYFNPAERSPCWKSRSLDGRRESSEQQNLRLGDQ
jgi:mannose-6-phosphate isomerase